MCFFNARHAMAFPGPIMQIIIEDVEPTDNQTLVRFRCTIGSAAAQWMPSKPPRVGEQHSVECEPAGVVRVQRTEHRPPTIIETSQGTQLVGHVLSVSADPPIADIQVGDALIGIEDATLVCGDGVIITCSKLELYPYDM